MMMQEILPGVFLVPPNGRKGFGYFQFVRRSSGNLLVDASRLGSISEAFDELEAAGGVRIVVIGDRHLGGASTNEIAERFGAKVHCSDIEAAAMGHRANRVRIDGVLPYRRSKIDRDVEVIPTPGHTPGQLSTLAKVGRAKILFTGDFVWREDRQWRPGNWSRKKMLKSFEGLRKLQFSTSCRGPRTPTMSSSSG